MRAPSRSVALTAHQPGALQLAELTTDVGPGEAGGFDQGGHIRGPLPQLAEQLQARRFAQRAEELAVLLQELRGGNGASSAHTSYASDSRIMPSRRP